MSVNGVISGVTRPVVRSPILFKGVGVVPVPDLPRTGMISEYRFAEGSGTTVADSHGAYPINLALPTTPNYTWSARGVSLAAGLIQTPSLPGVRTVAIFYKTTRNSTPGFLISGGSSSGAGTLQDSGTAAFNYWFGGGWGVHPLRRRASDSTAHFEQNRGGYGVLFQEFNTAYTTALGLGGRHSTTTSRCDGFEIVAAAVWSTTLSDADRAQVYAHWRQTGRNRAVYLNWRDCPTTAKAIILAGESTADGRSKITELTAPEQAQDFTYPKIMVSNGSTFPAAFATFDLGVNQQVTAPTTDFGPEVGMAQSIETAAISTYIIKLGKGSTFLSLPDAKAVNNPTTVSSWNAECLPAGLLWNNMTRELYDADQVSRAAGIGLDVRGIQYLIGLNDAQDVLYTGNSAATYQGYIQALYDAIQTYTGLTGLKVHMPRAHPHDPSSNATALAQVRQAQADFITALGSLGQLQDTDALGRVADLVHFNGAASKTIGAAGYAFLAA